MAKYVDRIQRENTVHDFLALDNMYLSDYGVDEESLNTTKNPLEHHGLVLMALVALHGGHVLGIINAKKPLNKTHTLFDGTRYADVADRVVYIGRRARKPDSGTAKAQSSEWALLSCDHVYTTISPSRD